MRPRLVFLFVFVVVSRTGRADGSRQALDEAKALQQKGAVAEARKRYEALLPSLRATDRESLGKALLELGNILSAQGDYDGAIGRARESADVFRSLGDKSGEARAVYGVGVAQLYQARYPEALENLNRSVTLARAAADSERVIEALSNIATLHFLQARYLEALRAYREALDALDGQSGQPWAARLRRILLTNLAALFQRVGQEEQALQIYAELRSSKESLAPAEQARLLSNLGVLYRRLNDPLKALETYRTALRLLATNEHKEVRVVLLKNIGIVEALDLGDLPAALEAFTSALELSQQSGDRREAMQARLYRGETLSRQGEAKGAAAEFEAALAAARELGTTEEQWKALYGLGRIARAAGREEEAAARFREAIGVIESVRARLQITSLKTDFLADKRDVYDALLEILLQRGDGVAMFELLERARARTFQDRLAMAPPGLAAVQARLDEKTLLLEYWVGPHGAAVLWVTHAGNGLAPLPASAADQGGISQLLQGIASGSAPEETRSAAALGVPLLAAPLRAAPATVRHLIVVPDGSLGEIPFEVLDPGDGGALIERYDVSYLPSAALLLREPERRSRLQALPWSGELVAFADPKVHANIHGVARELGGAELQSPLPASADEARAIAHTCGGRSRLYLGDANLKSRLLQAPRLPLLHLATHAVADTTNPERSRILFSPAHPEDTADYLFLKEVYELDLRGVDLTTLSACDTERGKLVRGEGAQGFGRALLSAGSRTAVTTLWRVADLPTRDFMKQFYYELSRGEPKAQALRLAKLRFLRSGTELSQPRFWAAFVLSGDGLTPIPRVLSWSTLLAALAVLLLAGTALAIRRHSLRRSV
ncbi:MAG TPA: CHAT domain-containing tetratricopeptide repeat protein [Myxococcales bacterium]